LAGDSSLYVPLIHHLSPPLSLTLPCLQLADVHSSNCSLTIKYLPNVQAGNNTVASGPRNFFSNVSDKIMQRNSPANTTTITGTTGSTSNSPGNSNSSHNNGSNSNASIITSIWYTDTPDEASELASAIHNACKRLTEALLWLDKGLPVNTTIRPYVATAELTLDGTVIEIVADKKLQWDKAFTVPRAFSSRIADSSLSKAREVKVYMGTPLGPHRASVPLTLLDKVCKDDGSMVELQLVAVPVYVESNDADLLEDAMSFSVLVTLGIVKKKGPVPSSSPSPPSFGLATMSENNNSSSTTSSSKWLLTGSLVAALLAILFSTTIPITISSSSTAAATLPLGLSIASCLTCLAGLYLITSSSQTVTTTTTTIHSTSKEQLYEYEVRLLAAEVVEESGQEPLLSGSQKAGPLLSQTGSASFSYTKSLPSKKSKATTGSGGGAKMVDIGAPTMARVSVLKSTTAKLSLKRRTTLEGLVKNEKDLTTEEVTFIESLSQKSPAATNDLYIRYVAACRGNRVKAAERLELTMNWRQGEDVDSILNKPLPHFKECKAHYRHAVIGIGKKSNMPIVVEGVGKFRTALKDLKAKNVPTSAFMHQFIWIMEYVTQRMNNTPMPNGKFIRVYDVTGMGLTDVADKEGMTIGQGMMQVLEQHYPERMHKALVVNAPRWFSAVWKVVAPLLDPSTAQKIQIFSNRQDALAALLEELDGDQIPKDLGGEGSNDIWYNNPLEKEMFAYVDKVNNRQQ
jgi:hypothetical protein